MLIPITNIVNQLYFKSIIKKEYCSIIYDYTNLHLFTDCSFIYRISAFSEAHKFLMAYVNKQTEDGFYQQMEEWIVDAEPQCSLHTSF